jgi:cytochrome c-type biogenesis protein CcmH/NrfG
LFVTFSILAGAACAPAPATSASNPAAVHSASDVITEKDLADPTLAGSTVLEAIRRLRPRFLNDRSGGYAGREGGPKVSMNGSAAFVAAAELSRLGVVEVSEIRYLSAADASQRFGLQGTLSPVLLVTLKRP